MHDTHYYEVSLLWDVARQATSSLPIIASKIDVARASELRAMKQKWTPEHLFVVAVNSCLMSTFLLITNNSKFEFISFESNSVGKIENIDGNFAVTEIAIKSTLIIPYTQNKVKAKRVLEMTKNACSVAGSIKTKIDLQPIIKIE